MRLITIRFLLLLLFSGWATGTPPWFTPRRLRRAGPAALPPTISQGFYEQTLDHFNYKPESYATFPQRYFLDSQHWGGPNSSSPFFVYFGDEAPLEEVEHYGFISKYAARFKGFSLYIEHRFFGKSIPFESREEAFRNASTLGYYNSMQAMADYAEIILHLKEKLHAQDCPVVVFGGSYGGMLAAWFRLKYPHIATGALASSAPVLYFDDITPSDAYYSIVSKDFKDTSETCFTTIKKSWAEIDRVAAQRNGLSILSDKFKTCEPLTSSRELKYELKYILIAAAQYDDPQTYPVKKICEGIDNASSNDILAQLFAGVVSYDKGTCYLNAITNMSETEEGWEWQRCSEMLFPISIEGGADSMFEPIQFDLRRDEQYCEFNYGVTPRPHWITTYYGGRKFKSVLREFGSNIIFSNGLRDPYSGGGVLENISDTITAVYTREGSHCLDLVTAQTSDPAWLVEQREKEMAIIENWIKKYTEEDDESKGGGGETSGFSSSKLFLFVFSLSMLAHISLL